MKEIKFNSDARSCTSECKTLANTVVTRTKGRNVLLDKSFGAPKFLRMVLQLLKRLSWRISLKTWGSDGARVASKTNDELVMVLQPLQFWPHLFFGKDLRLLLLV